MRKASYKKVIDILIAVIPDRQLLIVLAETKKLENEPAIILKEAIKKHLNL